MTTVHVIGAGLAGLACAVRLAAAGRPVRVYEAALRAGGRCRSFEEPVLDATIDNGNHLLMAANRAALAYLDEIGADDPLTGPAEPAFPFIDLASGARWTLRPNRGRAPWWVLVPSRRVPHTQPRDYLSGLTLLTAPAGATVAERVRPTHPLYRPFWEPLTVAVMNADPATAAAAPLAAVLRETFGRGGEKCRPLVARVGLGPAFVDPALETLAKAGVAVGFGRRLRALDLADGRAATLRFGQDEVGLAPDDEVVLAVTPSVAASLLPDLEVPAEGAPIVNAHYRLPQPVRLPGDAPFVGLLGGAAQWLFLRGHIASVTVSGADALVDRPAEELSALLWRDVARALELPAEPLPRGRIVKEKRATFVQTPANLARRPPTLTRWRNVRLAGDWTDTGLPATIESAIRSGHAAAESVLAGSRRAAA